MLQGEGAGWGRGDIYLACAPIRIITKNTFAAYADSVPASSPRSGRWQRPVRSLSPFLPGAARVGEPRASLPGPAGSAKGRTGRTDQPCAPVALAEALTLQGSPWPRQRPPVLREGGRAAPGGLAAHRRGGPERTAASVGKYRSSGGDLPG